MSIRKRDVHFSDWTKVRHALVCNNVQGITETSSLDEVRAFLINSESGSNPFYYYVCYIKETNEIYTHGTFYNCTGYNDSDIRDLIQNVEDSFVEQITALQNEVEENEKVTTMALYDLNDRKANKDDLQNINLDKYVDWDSLYSETNSLYSSLQSSINSNYTTLNNNKANKADLEALSAEVEENEEVTAAALTELHENKADKSEIPDVSTLATKDDINLKQDVLSASDFATINGASVFGGDDIVIAEPDHYASGTATVDGSGFVTSVTTNEAGHVTKVSARAITDNDITSISASKITGTINIDNLPTGALERMFVVEDETAAMSATVEEGDVVQVTGNGNKMYFCVRSGATTFSEKFMEFTAGTATSVAWSGVTGKPEGIDGWGDRISTVEADIDNYLPLTGGTISQSGYWSTKFKSTGQTSSGIAFEVANGNVGYLMYCDGSKWQVTAQNWSATHTLLHSGNYNTYSPSLTGAGASGSWGIDITGTASSALTSTLSYSLGGGHSLTTDRHRLTFLSGQFDNNTTPTAGQVYVGSSENWDVISVPVLDGTTLKSNAMVMRMGFNTKFWHELATRPNGRELYHRSVQNGVGNEWGKLLDSSNYSNYALPLTGGTVTGQITSEAVENFVAKGTDYSIYFGIGSGQVNRGIYDVTNNDWWIYRAGSTDTYIPNGNVAIGGTTADEKLHVHGKMVVSGNIKIPGSNDGRYSLYSDGGIRFYAPSSGGWSHAWNLFSNDAGASYGSLCGAFGEGSSLSYLYFGGTWNSPKTVQWPDGTFSIGRGTTKDTGMLNVGGNIRIFGDSNPLIAFSRGSDSARYVQAVSTGIRVGVGGTTNLLIQDDGKCKAVDFITTSDNRLKDFVSDIDLDFEALKLIPKKYYYWKDKSMGEDLQIGTSAQELAKIYPTCVSYDEVSDRYSVNYQKLSIVALAAIDKLHERVSELESKLND